MTDAITITYWEGDETKDLPFTALHYCEWTYHGRHYYAYADESAFNHADESGDLDEYRDDAGNYEHRGIPLEVRRTLAALIFPPLKDHADV
jgi:hypothetical protein